MNINFYVPHAKDNSKLMKIILECKVINKPDDESWHKICYNESNLCSDTGQLLNVDFDGIKQRKSEFIQVNSFEVPGNEIRHSVEVLYRKLLGYSPIRQSGQSGRRSEFRERCDTARKHINSVNERIRQLRAEIESRESALTGAATHGKYVRKAKEYVRVDINLKNELIGSAKDELVILAESIQLPKELKIGDLNIIDSDKFKAAQVSGYLFTNGRNKQNFADNLKLIIDYGKRAT